MQKWNLSAWEKEFIFNFFESAIWKEFILEVPYLQEKVIWGYHTSGEKKYLEGLSIGHKKV